MKHRHHSSRWILLLAATTSLGVSGLARAQVPFMDENLDVALLMEGFAINPENLDSLVLAELGYLGYVREVQVAALIEEAAAQVEAQAAEALENQELFGTDLVTADYGHCDTYGAWVGEYARLVATVPEDTSDATNDNTQSVDVQGFSEVLVGPCDCWTTEEFDIEGARLGLEATALILTGGRPGMARRT